MVSRAAAANILADKFSLTGKSYRELTGFQSPTTSTAPALTPTPSNITLAIEGVDRVNRSWCGAPIVAGIALIVGFSVFVMLGGRRHQEATGPTILV